MSARPLLLDLFCGAGGSAVGYHRAGFDIIGIDIAPQRHYPFEFIQGDALEVLADIGKIHLSGRPFDAIHASPPCQHYANVTAWRGNRTNHPDMITQTRAALITTGLPWVIENVPEAPLRPDYLLCGTMFGLNIQRHRSFETSWRGHQFSSPCCHHRDVRPFMHKHERTFADLMGCTWMTSREAREAIPPAYTLYIGTQLLTQLEGAA